MTTNNDQTVSQTLPPSQLAKAALADPKTTNVLLMIVVLCMSGYMPESMQTLCGI